MTSLPDPVTRLVAALGRLPGIGPRSAERLALHLVQSDADGVRQLAAALVEARERVTNCERCGALTEAQPCPICADPRRDGSLLCVVERALGWASAWRKSGHVGGGPASSTCSVAS
jgi:recombination protein RecR